MAEFILRHLAEREGIRLTVSSSATSTEEIWNGVGSPFYAPAAEQLRRHKIAYTKRCATLLKRSDYAEYDMLIGMDSANLRNMHRILGGDPDGKLYKLMDIAGRGGDVSDPWYTRRFDIAYDDIYEGCVALIERIKENSE